MQGIAPPPPQLTGLSVTRMLTETGTARFDLAFGVVDQPDAIRGYLEYSSTLFRPATPTIWQAECEHRGGAAQNPRSRCWYCVVVCSPTSSAGAQRSLRNGSVHPAHPARVSQVLVEPTSTVAPATARVHSVCRSRCGHVHAVAGLLPADVALTIVRLPGRESRMTEPPLTDVDAVTDGSPWPSRTAPAFPGASSGTASEPCLPTSWRCGCLSRATGLPDLLLVGGAEPPHLSRIGPSLSALPCRVRRRAASVRRNPERSLRALGTARPRPAGAARGLPATGQLPASGTSALVLPDRDVQRDVGQRAGRHKGASVVGADHGTDEAPVVRGRALLLDRQGHRGRRGGSSGYRLGEPAG